MNLPVEKSDVWTVSRLNLSVRDIVQNQPGLRNVWVGGEIYNLTYHASGHIYLSLKDDESTISCTFFKGANARFRNLKLRAGMKVIVRGNVTVYVPRGSYQLNIQEIRPAGEGDLRQKIEQLKKKLSDEGLFQSSRKQQLPVLPMTLGVASAATGAAIKDIIRVARRRFPRINILLAPCLVQGEGAVDSVIAAIDALNQPEWNVDIIIAGRGGGSFEDLLAFSDEKVVRAYAASRIPIISAVGHEIDNPISDLAADVAAPTPSAAAEAAVPEIHEFYDRLEDSGMRLRAALRNRHSEGRERLRYIMGSAIFQSPLSILETPSQSLDLVWKDLRSSMRDRVREERSRLKDYDRLPDLFKARMSTKRSHFELAAERLQSFSPLGTLGRGYAVLRDEKGQVIRASEQVIVGQKLETLLGKGRLRVRVEETIV